MPVQIEITVNMQPFEQALERLARSSLDMAPVPNSFTKRFFNFCGVPNHEELLTKISSNGFLTRHL